METKEDRKRRLSIEFWDLNFPSSPEVVGVYKIPRLEEKCFKVEPKPNNYPAHWDHLYQWCLNMHYKNNSHHPEYYQNPQKEMTLLDRMELTCDLLATVMSHSLQHKMKLSLEECRTVIEHQNWKHWKEYALTEYLPPASQNIRNPPPRRKIFPEEERTILKDLYKRLQLGEDERKIKSELYELQSVAFYKKGLELHRKCVEQVWLSIKEFITPEMEFRISALDQDKNRTEMIIGFTAQWCFFKK